MYMQMAVTKRCDYITTYVKIDGSRTNQMRIFCYKQNAKWKSQMQKSPRETFCSEDRILALLKLWSHYRYVKLCYLALINRAGGLYGLYGRNAVTSVHTTEVKILPYRPTLLG